MAWGWHFVSGRPCPSIWSGFRGVLTTTFTIADARWGDQQLSIITGAPGDTGGATRAFTHIALVWFLKIRESLPLRDLQESCRNPQGINIQ